jgi:DNA-binding NarL/FixJ family response regulator
VRKLGTNKIPIPPDRTLRIVIADDHELMRAGIRTMFSHNPLWKICGEAENGRKAVEKVRELGPDLVILDISMPVLNGIDAAREIRQIAPGIKIIMLTMHESSQLESVALQAGADVVLTKRMAASSLANAIDRLTGMGTVVQANLAEDSGSGNLELN